MSQTTPWEPHLSTTTTPLPDLTRLPAPAPGVVVRDGSFTDVFTSALRGLPCSVLGLGDAAELLPVSDWLRDADAADHALLERCRGRTIDVGCGPGRMAEALALRGHPVLGVDVVTEAVAQTRRRGVPALCCDVFETLPEEGSWDTVLLADGNLGIGGAPQRLLERARDLLAPRGRVVVEVEAPGVVSRTEWAVLECDGVRSRPFRWSVVGADDIAAHARAAGFPLAVVEQFGPGRWAAVLRTSR